MNRTRGTSIRRYIVTHRRLLFLILLAILALSCLLLYKLGSLVGGLSTGELAAVNGPLGWHGLYRQPLDLPLNFVRSVVFYIAPHHGQTLARLPNVLFGGFSVIALTAVVRLWHGKRVALMTAVLFATSAWTLHVSRLASYDVLYLWGTTMLVLVFACLQRYGRRPSVFYASMFTWGILLYIPGFIWLVIGAIVLQRKLLAQLWRLHHRWQERSLFLVAAIIWLPLLVIDLSRRGQFIAWLGLPPHLATLPQLLKQLGGVLVHLFIRGPQYPALWLARAPLLDVFTLAVSVLGIYYYGRRLDALRSRFLAVGAILGILLVAIGGAVSLSILVPLLYIAAATGLAYLQHEWFRVFPLNPLAKGLAYGLIGIAIVFSCAYNLRAYFVAWPHNEITRLVFRTPHRP